MSSSAICGGVISSSMHKKNMRQDIWADTMAFVMSDKHYKRYVTYLKSGKKKEAKEIFDKYAISQI